MKYEEALARLHQDEIEFGYGVKHDFALDHLNENGSKVYRCDECGRRVLYYEDGEGNWDTKVIVQGKKPAAYHPIPDLKFLDGYTLGIGAEVFAKEDEPFKDFTEKRSDLFDD